MKKLLNKYNLFPLIIIVACFFLFLGGFSTYFHQDDFIHLSFSQTVNQVISAFNIFQKGEFPFYRPIPTQLYFFIGKILFGFHPLGYHLINFFIFSINILLLYRLVIFIAKNKIIASLAAVFFAINSTHFAPLYSPAYVHELFYVFFGLLTVDNYLRWNSNKKLKNYLASLIFFIGALMSKETAIVLPIILFLCNLFLEKTIQIKKSIQKLFSYFAILAIYLFAHFIFYGIAQGPSYVMILGKQTINILAWYFLWALSSPNILIDFIQPGLKINRVFFQIAQFQGYLYIVFFPILLILGLFMLFKLINVSYRTKNYYNLRIFIFGLCWFAAGMVPLIIFPLHKLATEQAFSLVGLSFALGVLCFNIFRQGIIAGITVIFFTLIYLLIASNSIILAKQTHWIVRSASQAKRVIDYFKSNYPDLAGNTAVIFRNGDVIIPEYGSSRQLYQSLGNGVGLKMLLNKPDLRLYFEDIEAIPSNLYKEKNLVEIDSSKFLGY